MHLFWIEQIQQLAKNEGWLRMKMLWSVTVKLTINKNDGLMVLADT